MERVWVDPRSVRRHHIGSYKLEPDKGGFLLGHGIAIASELSDIPGSDRIVRIGVYAPRSVIILRQSVLNYKDFAPKLAIEGDPAEVVDMPFSLGFAEGYNNRLYIGSGISVARIPDSAGDAMEVVIAAADPDIEIRPQPPNSQLNKLLNRRP